MSISVIRPALRGTTAHGLVRGLLATILLWAAALLGPAALAHGGEDHGDEKQAAAVTAAQPRVSAQSETYELVGILRGGRLAIHLDRFETNELVTDAAIEVTIGGDETALAEPAADSTYALTSSRFAGSGPLELVFAVKAKAGDDLLIGTLVLPTRAAPAAVAPAPPSSWRARLTGVQEKLTGWIASGSALPKIPSPMLSLTFIVGLGAGLLLRSGWRLVPAAALAALGLLVLVGVAFGHEGEDHGDPGKALIAASDAPQRLPDGGLFIPKPSQRLLEVRTVLTKVETAQRGVALIGRVVADPNRSGLVQSINGGRVIAPERGLPRIGQAVKRGEVLAQVEPALPQADRTTISEKVGDIEQQIAVAETKLNRVRPLAERGIVPQSQVVDAQTEIEGLKRRREIVGRTRVEPEVLRAPIDGVISAAKIVAGQVVQAQDVLFQLVDPKGLWVEALVYGEINPAQIADASASVGDGQPLNLAYQGFSRALQEQASVVQFAVLNPPAVLSVGQPVTVVAKTGAAVEGIILPREAVVRGPNGEALVWRHTDPERFEARHVRTEPFDATRLVVLGGLTPGERVVVRGAELINQVR